MATMNILKIAALPAKAPIAVAKAGLAAAFVPVRALAPSMPAPRPKVVAKPKPSFFPVPKPW